MNIPKLKTLLENTNLSGNVTDTINYLSSKKDSKVLFITTSTRYPFNTGYDKGGVEDELPKSTELALHIKKWLGLEYAFMVTYWNWIRIF